MNVSERLEKFTEFRKLVKDGNRDTLGIARTLGISKNTVYNWRKRLRTERTQPVQQSTSEKQTPQLFSRVVVSPAPVSAPASSIEIVIKNNIIIRIPDHSPSTLQTILDSFSQWGCIE
jgi:transposase-like protein